MAAQVDGGDVVGSEDDVVEAVGVGGADSDEFALEGFGDAPALALEADAGVGGDAARLVVGAVVEGFDDGSVGPGAGGVAVDGSLHAERFVGPLGVVDPAPAIEVSGGMTDVVQGLPGQGLGLEGAVEALVLALGLRMVGPRVTDADVLLDQPDAERGEGVARSITPGRAVVHGHAPGQAVTLEGLGQMAFHGLGFLIVAGGQDDAEA